MKEKKPNAKLVLLDAEHSGRDEMNLAGNPFALLQAASKNTQTYIRYEWDRKLPNGRVVKASWEVSGHSELGLPGPTEELIYLILLQLTREAAESDNGEWPQTVYFSRYDVVRRLGWSDSNHSYRALRDAFARLASVNITADHSFWDARQKAPFSSVNFGILNESVIADEPKGRKTGQSTLPLSRFEWNKIVHGSFIAGNLRSLALDFVISLDHPSSRRLFRLLEMLRNASTPPRRQLEYGLIKLRDRLGMADYRYASKIKEKLKPAFDELISRQYLTEVTYRKNREGEEIAIFHFGRGDTITHLNNESDGELALDVNKTSALKKGQSKMANEILTQPSRQDIELGFLLADQNLKDSACDAIFHGLDETTKIKMYEWAKDLLPEFLLSNLSSDGTKISIQNHLRKRIWDEYRAAVCAHLLENI